MSSDGQNTNKALSIFNLKNASNCNKKIIKFDFIYLFIYLQPMKIRYTCGKLLSI